MRSIHTSGRTFLTPDGNAGYTFVALGNLFSARVVLLILVCCWRNLRWVLEQPEGSFLPHMERLEWLWGVVQVGGTSNIPSKAQNICLNSLPISPHKENIRPQVFFVLRWSVHSARSTCCWRNQKICKLLPILGGLHHDVLHGEIWWWYT